MHCNKNYFKVQPHQPFCRNINLTKTAADAVSHLGDEFNDGHGDEMQSEMKNGLISSVSAISVENKKYRSKTILSNTSIFPL